MESTSDMHLDEPSPTFEETLASTKERLQELREERKVVLQRIGHIVLRKTHAGPEYNDAEDRKLKSDLETESAKLLADIEEYDSLVKQMTAMQEDEDTPVLDSKTSNEGHHVVYNKTDKVTLDSSTPRFGPKKLAASVGAGITVLESPLELLEKFHAQASNIHGPNFDKVCSRLLSLAILDDDQQRRLARAMESSNQTLTWRTCEQLFTDTLLTSLEKDEQAKTAIAKGMRPGESYERYAWRLERIVRIYKICESPSHATLLKHMK
ncbi:hypothetical protein BGX31_005624, partial [Mortierella sp. GBA43]